MNTVMSSTHGKVQCNELTYQKKSKMYENEEEKVKEPVEIGDGGNKERLIHSRVVTEATIYAGCVCYLVKIARVCEVKMAGPVVELTIIECLG